MYESGHNYMCMDVMRIYACQLNAAHPLPHHIPDQHTAWPASQPARRYSTVQTERKRERAGIINIQMLIMFLF